METVGIAIADILGGFMVMCQGWCGYCYAGVRGRQYFKGHAGHGHPLTKERVKEMALVRSGKGVSRPLAGGYSPPDDVLLCSCPDVVAFLSCESWPDGESRERGSLSVIIEDGVLKGVLNDKDGRRSAYIAADSLEQLLERLERAVGSPTTDWRAWKGQSVKRRS